MKDIHSHILYGIDDGSRGVEESIELLDHLYYHGVTDIILTPHYIENSKYSCNNKKKAELLQELQQQYKKINLYLGNEVYITENILDLLKKEEIMTLNYSRYLLIELPMNSEIKNLDSIIFDLVRNNIIPIIAHPERYRYVQKNIHYFDEFRNMGILLQGNYESLFNQYGSSAKKTLKKLLREDMISFLASDMHRIGYMTHIELLDKKLARIVKDTKKRKALLEDNIEKVIHDEDI
ncbi:MAG: hypothetical protein HFJ12_05665 [Bacilli bacterium]|nr:hypothetical protein [Bacilli bacterium]